MTVQAKARTATPDSANRPKIKVAGSTKKYPDANEAEGRADLLDDLGDLVRARGGEVLVVPAEQMPATTGAAAICRY